MFVNTPEECVKKLSDNYSSENELHNSISEITIAHHFKLKKINGNKKYFYYECYKSGVGRSIDESLKIRDRTSIKTGNDILLASFIIKGCPFKLSYKLSEKTQRIEFNPKKSNFSHNHVLDYEGLTSIEKENVCKFIAFSEMEKSKKPIEIKDASEAYLKGQSNDNNKKIPKEQVSYLHQKVKKNIYGPLTKDASLLNELQQELIQKHPNCCIKSQINEQNQLFFK